jgi:iron-sulfur cluster assembly accessory protein
MVEITDSAVQELKSLMESENKEDYALRIFVAGIGCSGVQYGMALDNEKNDDDVTVTSKEVKVVMAPDVVEELNEAKIDFIESPEGKGFIIDNPKAVSACGSCGSGCH